MPVVQLTFSAAIAASGDRSSSGLIRVAFRIADDVAPDPRTD